MCDAGRRKEICFENNKPVLCCWLGCSLERLEPDTFDDPDSSFTMVFWEFWDTDEIIQDSNHKSNNKIKCLMTQNRPEKVAAALSLASDALQRTGTQNKFHVENRYAILIEFSFKLNRDTTHMYVWHW